MLIQPSRRSFIRGLASLVAAPVVIRVAKLMPISVVREPWDYSGALEESFRLTKEFYAARVLTQGTMYDLLYPGLRKITMNYTHLEESYPKIFAARVLPLIGE